MTRIRKFALAALCLMIAAPAFAQSATGSGQAQGQGSGAAQFGKTPSSGQTQSTDQPGMKIVQADGTTNAQAEATAETNLEARKTLMTIKDKGAKVSATARAKADAKLEAAAKKANDEATKSGDQKVAARLGAEFGATAEAMMSEKQTLDASWGELMIAHSLDANTKTEVTVAQLFELRKEGTGWGQIAAGLGLKLGDCVSAAQSEAKVATGMAKADGKVAVIHGEGARAGVGVNAGSNAGLNAGAVHASTQTGLGVGVKIKP
jgi:hypothetical protein